MKRLALPPVALDELFHACVAGVGDEHLQGVYNSCYTNFEEAEGCYYTGAKNEQLCFLPRTVCGRGEDPIVLGSLTKKQLTQLYTQYMVPLGKPARFFYDVILASANGRCPFCGGIGHAKTLDHYLPKANFPQYSVLPANLVPCCRDCNAGKTNSVANRVEEQVVHPYLDKDCFFDEQWVVACVVYTDPIVIHYEASPPVHWSTVDRQRAVSHFDEYDLRERYGIESGAELSNLIYLRQGILKAFSAESFQAYLFAVAIGEGQRVNSWKRVMYQALAHDEWFCSYEF